MERTKTNHFLTPIERKVDINVEILWVKINLSSIYLSIELFNGFVLNQIVEEKEGVITIITRVGQSIRNKDKIFHK